MGWDIRKGKKFVPSSLIEEKDKIDLCDWREYIEEGEDFIWAEDSLISKAFIKEGKEWVKKERYKMNAYYEINKKGIGNLRFKYFEGYISIDCERQTLRRVEKMWEVAECFNAFLFKNGTRFTEKKLERLREKYDKSGKKAPNNNQEA